MVGLFAFGEYMSTFEKYFLVSFVICFLFFSSLVTAITIHGDYKVAEMVNYGVDPLAARCAISARTNICAMASIIESNNQK